MAGGSDDPAAPALGLAPTPGGGWVPVPDPTALTTLQLRRELSSLRELLELQIAALKELMLTRFGAAEEAVAAALASAEQAVGKAEVANEKRFDAVNDFRGQLSDQAATFLTRHEYEVAYQAVLETIAEMRAQLNSLAATIVPRLETDAWREAMSEKMELATGRNAEAIQALSSRMDIGQGSTAGGQSERTERRLDTGQLLQLLVLIGLAIGLVISFFHK